MNEAFEIRELARALSRANKRGNFDATVSSGDREPDAHASPRGRKWIIDGLRLLAKSKEPKATKAEATPPRIREGGNG